MTAQSCLSSEASLLLDVLMEAEPRILDGDISADDAMYLMAMIPIMKNHILRIFEIDEWQNDKLKEARYGYYHEHPEARRPHIAA